jgi:hypothetical protein
MAGTITHFWNGTVLTVTSDSGTSSMDLSGPTGCRGPQGRPGVIYDSDGNLYLDDIPSGEEVAAIESRMDRLENSYNVTTEYVAAKIDAELEDYYTKAQTDAKLKNVSVDLTGYATEAYVDNAIANAPGGGGSVDVDLSDYATKAYVNNAVANVEADVDLTDYPTRDEMTVAIAQAQLGGSGDGSDIDLSGFATKAELAKIADAETIVYRDGKISTSFGGRVIGHEGGDMIGIAVIGSIHNDAGTSTGGPDAFVFTCSNLSALVTNSSYRIQFTINGELVTVDNIPCNNRKTPVYNKYFYAVSLVKIASMAMIEVYVNDVSLDWTGSAVSNITVFNALRNVYEPIDANALPIDNSTIGIRNGKLAVTGNYATYEYVDNAIANASIGGGGSGESVVVDLSNYYTKSEVDDKIANVSVDLSNYYTKAQTQAYVLEQKMIIEQWVNQKFAEIVNSEGVGY